MIKRINWRYINLPTYLGCGLSILAAFWVVISHIKSDFHKMKLLAMMVNTINIAYSVSKNKKIYLTKKVGRKFSSKKASEQPGKCASRVEKNL